MWVACILVYVFTSLSIGVKDLKYVGCATGYSYKHNHKVDKQALNLYETYFKSTLKSLHVQIVYTFTTSKNYKVLYVIVNKYVDLNVSKS